MESHVFVGHPGYGKRTLLYSLQTAITCCIATLNCFKIYRCIDHLKIQAVNTSRGLHGRTSIALLYQICRIFCEMNIPDESCCHLRGSKACTIKIQDVFFEFLQDSLKFYPVGCLQLRTLWINNESTICELAPRNINSNYEIPWIRRIFYLLNLEESLQSLLS